MARVNAIELRQAFATFMTGVTVVTALGDDGCPVGFTANSYTSVSLDPPLLLVCPSKSLSSFAVFDTCTHFVVNILAEDQQDISNIFATSSDDRFNQVSWQADKWGCPIIDRVAASFCCTAHNRMDAGDHIILVGEINDFQSRDAAGLGYSRDGYFSFGLERKTMVPVSADRKAFVGSIIDCAGKILVKETPDGLQLPEVGVQKGKGVFGTLKSFVEDAGLGVEFGPVYSVFDNKTCNEVFTYYRGIAENEATGGLGEFVAVEELGSQKFASTALATMMQRYILEQKSGIFGLYVGDEARGDVHMFGEDAT